MNVPTAVVVLGMHRSGTSVVARALMALGADLGNNLQPAEPANPKGFFEDRSIVRLNREILEAVHCRWDSLHVPPIPPEVLNRFRAPAAAIIRERFGRSPLWGFKDPRATRLQPFWHEVISDAGSRPRYVLASRHPLEVAASLATRDAMPRGQALALWALHQAQGLDALVRNGGLVVDYERMLRAPEAQLRRLALLLSRPFGDRHPDCDAFTEVFLEPGLARSRDAGVNASPGSGNLEVLCRDIHQHLLMLSDLEPDATTEAAAEGNRLCEQVRRYFAGETEWLETIDAVQTARLDGLSRQRALEKSVRRLQSELNPVTGSRAYKVSVMAIGFMKRWRRRARRLLTGRKGRASRP